MTPPRGGRGSIVASHDEQIYSALLSIKEEMEAQRSDIRTLYKKLEEFQEERRNADVERKKVDQEIMDNAGILEQRVLDIEEYRRSATPLPHPAARRVHLRPGRCSPTSSPEDRPEACTYTRARSSPARSAQASPLLRSPPYR